MDMAQGADAQELLGLDGLFASAREGRPSQELLDLRAVMRRLPMLGPFNASLVHAQRPGAVYVAGAEQFARDFGRQLRPNARPLVILRPFGPVSFVYDVADTDGPPMPDDVLDAFRLSGPVTEDGLSALTDLLPAKGVIYEEADLGGQAGAAEHLDPPPMLGVGRSEVAQHHRVSVDRGLSVAARLHTLFRLLGSIHCHHLEPAASGSRAHLPALGQSSRDFEAATVAWLLEARLGLDRWSEAEPAEFLESFADQDGAMPPISVDAVVSATGKIEQIAGGLAPLARLLSGPRSAQDGTSIPTQVTLDLFDEGDAPQQVQQD
jgi:hypothetical protein